jgi:hypothetical protein
VASNPVKHTDLSSSVRQEESGLGSKIHNTGTRERHLLNLAVGTELSPAVPHTTHCIRLRRGNLLFRLIRCYFLAKEKRSYAWSDLFERTYQSR